MAILWSYPNKNNMKKTILMILSVLVLNVACSSDDKTKKNSDNSEVEEKPEEVKMKPDIQMEVLADGTITVWNAVNSGTLNYELNLMNMENRYPVALNLKGTEKVSFLFPNDFGFKDESSSEIGLFFLNIYIDDENDEMVLAQDVVLTTIEDEKANEAFDYEQFGPPTLRGKISNSIYWKDKTGHHFAVKSKVEDESGIYLNHFILRTEGKMDLKDWREHEIECGFDLMEQHAKKDHIDDADGDGVKEYYSLVVSDCKSDISPSKAYLYIIEGNEIYTLECSDKAEGEGLPQIPGEALKQNPKILDKAKLVWDDIAPNVGF